MKFNVIVIFIFTFLLYSCSDKGSQNNDVSFDRGQLGQLSTESSSQSLGEVPYQRPYELLITVKNGGVLTARNITPIEDDEENPVFYYTGGEYPGELGNCGETLKPGASCTLHFTFYTDEAGDYDKIFRYTYHDGENNNTKEIHLTAKAGAPAQFEFVDSNSGLYDLGGHDVTSSAKQKIITLKNIGDLSAKNIDLRLKGTTADDDEVYQFVGGSFPGTNGTCSTNLSGGDECTIVIQYKAKFIDTTHTASIQIDYDNPVIRESTNGSLKVLGIEDRAFITVSPANSNFSNIINTSTDSEITWTFSNVGSRDATTLNIVDAGAINLELVSTDCPASLQPETNCKSKYRLKPNFDPSVDGINFPRYSTEYTDRYPLKLTYDDGKNPSLAENTDFNIVYSVVGQGLLTLREDGLITDPIVDGHIWDKSEWKHTVGNTVTKKHTLTLQNGFSTTERTWIPKGSFNVTITPNDGLLIISDPTQSNNIESDQKITLNLEYISNLDDTTYPYLDAINKIREYDVKVTYFDQVNNQEINFKIQTQDLIEPIVSYAILKIKTKDDPNTVPDETEYEVSGVTPTVNDADPATVSGSNELLESLIVYSGKTDQTLTVRMFNCGLAPITPIIEKVANAEDSYFSFETIGTTCDNPIKSDGITCDITTPTGTAGTFCDIKLKFTKATEPNPGDLTTINDGTENFAGDRISTVFKFKDGFDQGDGDDSDKELHLQYDVVHREKGTLSLNTNHNPNITNDFVGDFATVDMLYDGESSREVTGFSKRLHFLKTGHGEIKNLKCTLEGTDKDYFTCNIVEVSETDFSSFKEVLSGSAVDYNYRTHVRYYAQMSFKLDNTTTIRSYSASAKIEYHSKGNAATDPYEVADVLNVPLAATVKGEPNFIFTASQPYNIGDFKIEETLSDITLEIKNIGGNPAVGGANAAVITYDTNLYTFKSFDDSHADCNFSSQNPGAIYFNANSLGICYLTLTPILDGDLEETLLDIFGNPYTVSKNHLILSYDNSYNSITKNFEFSANRLHPYTISPSVFAVGDLQIGEQKTITLTITTQLGKPTRDIDGGTGTPITFELPLNANNQAEFTNATSNATCDFISFTSTKIELHTLTTGSTTCYIDVTFTGKAEGIIRSTDTLVDSSNNPYPKTFEFSAKYSNSFHNFEDYIPLENDIFTVLNPLEVTEVSFNDLLLGEEQEVEFTVTNHAKIATNAGESYYSGPITLQFDSNLNALNTVTYAWVTTGQYAGCTFHSESSLYLKFHAAAETTCKIKMKVRHAAYVVANNAAGLINRTVLAPMVGISTFTKDIPVLSGSLLRSFAISNPSAPTQFMGKGVTSDTLTYDISVTSLAVLNTQDIKKAGSTTDTIDKLILSVTDTANYSLEWKDNIVSPDCSQAENLGTSIKFHINAGATCYFTLKFLVPGVGERDNNVELFHVNETQISKKIYGSGLNYAHLNLTPDAGKDLGNVQANSESTVTTFTMENTIQSSADGILKSLPVIDASGNCNFTNVNVIPNEYKDDPLRIERDATQFSVINDTCAIDDVFQSSGNGSCTFDIKFAPTKVDRVLYACVKYTFARYPGEPSGDWITKYVHFYGHSKAPNLVFAGFSTVKGEGSYNSNKAFIELQWPAMTIPGGTVNSYEIYRRERGVEDYPATPNYTQVTTSLIETTDDILDNKIYDYKIKAKVEFASEPGIEIIKTPISKSEITVVLPKANQIFSYTNKLVVERFESDGAGTTFNSLDEAITFCENRTVADLPMKLANWSEFIKLTAISEVQNLTDKNWEYINTRATINEVDGSSEGAIPFNLTQLDLEANNIFEDLNTILDFQGSVAACKIDSYTGPHGTRELLAGGSDSSYAEFGLPAGIDTKLWCHPNYSVWLDASGIKYPKGAARCVLDTP